jgi:hypothetical protein
LDAFPATFPTGIGGEAGQCFGVQITLAFEVTMEPAARQTGIGHDLIDRYVVESKTI